jgi:hypothetical protein
MLVATSSSDPKTRTEIDTGASTDPKAIRAPRWVRVFGAFSALFFAAFVVLHLLGGGLRHHSLPDVSSPRAPPDPAELRSADDARRDPARP